MTLADTRGAPFPGKHASKGLRPMEPSIRLELRVSGYVCEICCGQIPARAREAMVRRLMDRRSDEDIPRWLKRRNPSYVPTEAAMRLWYREDEAMREIMRGCGVHWAGYRAVDAFCHCIGFGSGKGEIGLFEIAVFENEERRSRYVAFDAPPEWAERPGRITDLKTTWQQPPEAPLCDEGYISVSGGSWAKGDMAFAADTEEPFEETALEIILRDLTPLGVGEDHFVAGFRYRGLDLPGRVIRETAGEMYPVTWRSSEARRWLLLTESGPLPPAVHRRTDGT